MLVFVTGAAGFIGRATMQELISHGHQVLGLARNDANAELITKLGGQVHRGDLEDLESLKSGARKADGVIHLAFLNDFTNFERTTDADVAAIEAMGEAMAGTGKPLVIASGTMLLEKGVLAAEDSDTVDIVPYSLRVRAAKTVYALSKEKQVRGSVVRLPPTVHGKEDSGFISIVINVARGAGSAIYVGDGTNRWPAVHRLDAAVVFRLALEKGKPGSTFHAVSEEGVKMSDIVGLIGKRLQLPVQSQSVEEAVPKLGLLAHVLAADNPTSSEITQKELGWDAKNTTQPGLLEDMDAHYFS